MAPWTAAAISSLPHLMSRCFESGGSSSSISPQIWSKTFLEMKPASRPPPTLTGMKSTLAMPLLYPKCPGWDSNPHALEGAGGFKPPVSDQIPPPGPPSSVWRNFPAATVSHGRVPVGSLRTSTLRTSSRACTAIAAAPAPDRRAARRAHPARAPRCVRGARAAVSAAPARLLPSHARLPGGRRGRAAGGLRRLLQRDLRRRPADQRPALALPDRPQPLPEPPAPATAGRAGLDGRVRARRRDHHRGHGPQARRVPPHRRRRAGPSRDAAHRPAPARDRRALLRADRRGDGHDRAEREVAAGPRARLA